MVDLRHSAERGGLDGLLASTVIENGSPFQKTERPKNIRKGKAKHCFGNAANAALLDKGIYVEGFAAGIEQPPFYHAWITLDGVGAVDLTLDDKATHLYFGIPFPTDKLVELMGMDKGFIRPVLNFENTQSWQRRLRLRLAGVALTSALRRFRKVPSTARP